MKIYDKPWKSYQEQLGMLMDRGLLVTEPAKALQYLERIGYYRLSGYWYPFREKSGAFCPLEMPPNRKKFRKGDTEHLILDTFKPRASFQHAVDLYVFDKKLRLLVLDALERIEVGLRVDISHTLGKSDPFAYLKPECLFEGFSQQLDQTTGLTEHHQWLAKQAGLITRSKEKFITHNKAKYGLPLPIWVACEIWDFGTLSTLFGGMKEADQDAIAIRYGVGNGRVFATWLRGLNYLRNVCAHHSRLWNRNMVDQLKLPTDNTLSWIDHFRNDTHRQARPFLLLCITKHLLATINPSSSWWQRLKALLREFPDLQHLGLDLVQGMGVVENWEEWN